MNNPALPKVTFPNGQSVCALGQGTWKMGRAPTQRHNEITALRHGLELGLDLIDTAEMYNNEDLVGEAIRPYRDKAFLVSKVLPKNASYEGTKLACEQSLKRLGTDYIDLYLLHWKGDIPFAETVRAMSQLQQEGKIRQWGVSNIDNNDLEQIRSLPHGQDCAVDQLLYNLVVRDAELEVIPWCQEHHTPIIAHTPIGRSRMLCNPKLNAVAKRLQVTPSQLALAWIISHPQIMTITKAGNIAHVDENFGCLCIKLSADDLKDLDELFPVPNYRLPIQKW